MKLILLAFVVAVSAKDDDIHRYTTHFHPLFNADLNLTSGELKLFSGHAMNMIKSKCPAVDSGKIFQVQKYLGKLIAKVDPVEGQSKPFHKVLESITKCAKEGVVTSTPKPTSRPSRIFDSILSPFKHIRTFWVQKNIPIQETVSEETPDNVDSGLLKEHVPTANPTEHDSSDQPMRVIKTTLFVRPENMKDEIRTSGGVFHWIRNMFKRVGNFFQGMFSFSSIRKRRDTSDTVPISDVDEVTVFPTQTTGQQTAEDIIKSDDEVTYHFLPMQPKEVLMEDKLMPGKKAFGELIDHMCNIYCSGCTDHNEMYNFKKAAKQLLIFLFEEDGGLELAAQKFLDEPFLKSIGDCGQAF